MHRPLSLLVFLLVTSGAQAAPRALTGLLIERGGNPQSIGNERIQIRYDGGVLYERGRAVTRKDPKLGTFTDGVCERYTWAIDEKALEALSAAIENAHVTELKSQYQKRGVHDGSQAGLLVLFPDRVVVSRFDNEFPPAYRALVEYLDGSVLKDAEGKGKKGRCDVATWLFIAPPNDSR